MYIDYNHIFHFLEEVKSNMMLAKSFSMTSIASGARPKRQVTNVIQSIRDLYIISDYLSTLINFLHVSLALSSNSGWTTGNWLSICIFLRLRCPATNIASIFFVYSVPTALLDCWKWQRHEKMLRHWTQSWRKQTKHLSGFCRQSFSVSTVWCVLVFFLRVNQIKRMRFG